MRYEAGQEYAPHYDMSESTNRLVTLLVYLDTPPSPEDGGGTSFPRAFENRGLEVYPQRGSAILFYDQTPDGNLDEMTLHGGMMVHKGVKRACNLWIHAQSRAEEARTIQRDLWDHKGEL